MEPFFNQFLQERERKQQEALLSQQQPPSQPQVAPNSPPNEATATADAALLATQQIQQQRQANVAKREQEAAEASASLDEADRFEQNAQMATQAAQESTQLAAQQRQEADQLAQIHQQEAAQEDDQLAQAEEVAKVTELVRVTQDPQVVAQVKPDLAQAIGVDVKDINEEVESTFREVQGIFSGQLDVNNQRQAALAEKIKSGEGFSKNEKIALGMAALLPIIVGAARGNLGQGLAAAGQSIESISNQQQQRQAQSLAERTALEDRELKLGQGKLSNVGKFVAQKGGVSGIDVRQQKAIEDLTQTELQNKGIKLSNVSRLEKAKQNKILTKSNIADFQQKIEKIASGELPAEKQGKISGDQRKAATFSVRMSQAEDIFGVLEDRGFSPVEGEGFLVNRLKTEERQSYDQAKRNFVNALLRRESGAAISDTEFASAEEQYFPQPGDAPAIVAQKRANRAVGIAGLQAEAGSRSIKDIHDILGNSRPITKVTAKAKGTDFSQMSDEELQRLIQGGE